MNRRIGTSNYIDATTIDADFLPTTEAVELAIELLEAAAEIESSAIIDKAVRVLRGENP